MSNRKLIRPSLTEMKDQMAVRPPRRKRPSSMRASRPTPRIFTTSNRCRTRLQWLSCFRTARPSKGPSTGTTRTPSDQPRSGTEHLASQALHQVHVQGKRRQRKRLVSGSAIFMRATIGISTGDPSGIGLEVILKAMPSIAAAARWILYTDAPAFDRHYVRFGTGFPYRWIKNPRRNGR